MYRMKGRISRTPLLTVAIAVRKFMTVPEIDRAFYKKISISVAQGGGSRTEPTCRYPRVGGGNTSSKPHQSADGVRLFSN